VLDLGASLLPINLAVAKDIRVGTLAGPALDERLICIEQSVVERSLQSARALCRTRPYSEFLRQMNGILNHDPWLGSLHFSPAVRWYSAVLIDVRAELASPLDFARQLHRETIGVVLTRTLRRSECPEPAKLPF
jgi:hypothetical protein